MSIQPLSPTRIMHVRTLLRSTTIMLNRNFAARVMVDKQTTLDIFFLGNRNRLFF